MIQQAYIASIMQSLDSSTSILAIVILALFIIGTVAWLFSRYRMCPSDKVLIVYGKVGAGQPARCFHGGATFVMPILQSYAYLELNPINIDVPLKGALSSQNIRVDVPSSFIVGISTLPELMQNAASRLLGRTRDEIRSLATEIIMGQMRVVIASMTIEEINADREKLIRGITGAVDVELHKVGLHLINANITDIQDASGYIAALGQEAAARAINDAMIKVAEETRRGEIGKAEAEKEQAVQVAMANAASIEGQNEAQIKVAESQAKLKVKQAEAHKLAEVAEKVQEAKAQEEAYLAAKEAELKRAELERATQAANVLVAAETQKRERELVAEASASVLKTEQRGKADALLIQREAEAAALRKLAEGEADALLLKKKAEGEGLEAVGRGEAAAIEAVLEGKARGFQQIVAASGSSRDASSLLVTEQLPKIVELQAGAISKLTFDKVVVMGNGRDASVGGFVQNLVKETLPLHEVAKSVGIELPSFLGSSAADASVAPKAPETKA
ncbi:flotillin family protein [Akkermansia glycaniphila]|nr:flotillin family protein [Akkermansia glycaniphila]